MEQVSQYLRYQKHFYCTNSSDLSFSFAFIPKINNTTATKGLDICNDDVIERKHFPHYWPFVCGIPHTKVSDTEFDVFFDLRLDNS